MVKTLRTTGQQKEFIYYGLRQSGGAWSATQVQAKLRRLRCPDCGVRRETVPWAGAWARVTTALARAVAGLARQLSWQETARHFRLDWKSVAGIVQRVVSYGLERRHRRPLHIL